MARKKNSAGVWKKKWIYILCNLPQFWVIKVGISDSPKIRVKQIDSDKGNSGRDFLLCAVERHGAEIFERIHHTVMFPLRWYWGFKGTGKTERFVVIAIVFTFLIFSFSGLVEMVVSNVKLAYETIGYLAISAAISTLLYFLFLEIGA